MESPTYPADVNYVWSLATPNDTFSVFSSIRHLYKNANKHEQMSSSDFSKSLYRRQWECERWGPCDDNGLPLWVGGRRNISVANRYIPVPWAQLLPNSIMSLVLFSQTSIKETKQQYICQVNANTLTHQKPMTPHSDNVIVSFGPCSTLCLTHLSPG